MLLREIREQPNAIRNTIEAESREVDRVAINLRRRRIHFLGMGSSYLASIYARYLLGEFTQKGAENHLASEFIHYPSQIASNDVVVALSQSGESIETVRAVQALKKKRNLVIGITNEPKSPLAALSDQVLLTHAGRKSERYEDIHFSIGASAQPRSLDRHPR